MGERRLGGTVAVLGLLILPMGGCGGDGSNQVEVRPQAPSQPTGEGAPAVPPTPGPAPSPGPDSTGGSFDLEALHAWITTHADDLSEFGDIEPTPLTDIDDDVADWFGDRPYAESGDRFIQVARMGDGSMYAAWLRPGVQGPPPIVFFGSDGDSGVLAKDPTDFAHALAFGTDMDDPDGQGTVRITGALSILGGEPDDDDDDDAAVSLRTYRQAVIDRFGALRTLDVQGRDVGPLATAFATWAGEP